MAQSAITVTPPNPTPPTNMSFLGTTPPTAPAQPVADDGAAGSLTVLAASTVSADPANFPSATHEGKGTEVVSTATSPNPSPYGQLQAVSVLGNYTTEPNKQHASSMSPATNPTLTALTPNTAAKGTGNQGLTVTGTNLTPGCRIWVNNQERPTTFVNATTLTTSFAKNPNAGVWVVEVKLGGVTMPTPQNFTWT